MRYNLAMEEKSQETHEKPLDLEAVLDSIEKVCQSASIFLYGSQARTDATPHSDYEIGVLIPEEKYVGRAVLRSAINDVRVSAYPFRLEQFVAGNPDTPFNKKIYMRELIASGRTLRGDKVIESLQLPSVEVVDALSDAEFNLGYALAATIAHRDGAVATANLLFYKSCLLGARALIMTKLGELPATYDAIVEATGKLDLGEYQPLIKAAYEARQAGIYDPNALFKNISFLNQVVVPALRETLSADASKVIVE